MKIVIGCSGGPDSMALLDMCRKKAYEIVVAHVNYRHRPTADRDEDLVVSYCQEHGIEVRVLFPVYTRGNFQAWARKVRYAFFQNCADAWGTKDIFVAHQLDDHLETYIFQKHRGMLCDTFGLAGQSIQKEYVLHRPLLQYEKRELQVYCKTHRIVYGIDESNLTDAYTRNRIRHTKVDALSKQEKRELVGEIDRANAALAIKREAAGRFNGTISQLFQISEAWFVLDWYLYTHTHVHYAKKHMESILQQIQSNCLIDLQTHWLEAYRGCLYCQKKQGSYKKVFGSIEYGHFGSYTITDRGKTIESVYVQPDDFPLIVRDARPNDVIRLRWGTKKVSRFFIDRKIPKVLRMHWKVIENAAGRVIFVPGIGCDAEHFSIHSTFFMIQ